MDRYLRESEKLIKDLYSLYYADDKKGIYKLLTNTFKEQYSLEQFLRYRQFRTLDLGLLRDVLDARYQDNIIIVPANVYIGGNELVHNFKCTLEEDVSKIIFERFFLPE